jgi:hypothetical protein
MIERICVPVRSWQSIFFFKPPKFPTARIDVLPRHKFKIENSGERLVAKNGTAQSIRSDGR